MESVSSSVDLGSGFPIDITSLESNYAKFYPQSPLSDQYSPLVFLVGSTENQYVQFSDSFLYLRVRILGASGAQITTGAYSPSFDFFASVFSGIEVEQNSTLISTTATLYPYRAHIVKLLTFGYGTKASVAKEELWYEDTLQDKFDTTNAGFKERMTLAAQSAPFEVVGKLSESLFEQGRFTLPEVTTKILLRRSLPEFCLEIGVGGPTSINYEIMNAVFFVRRHIVSESVLVYHHNLLASGHNLQYPVNHFSMRAFNIKSGSTSVLSETLFRGRIPSYLFITFVSTEALQGSLTKQCFNLQHFDVSQISAKIDGNSSVYESLKFNFSENEYILGYHSLLSALAPGQNHGISKDLYKAGQFLVCLGISPNNSLYRNVLEREGSIQIDLSFRTALDKAITCIVVGRFQGNIQIDKYYNVQMQ